jgi:hypothetical protein
MGYQQNQMGQQNPFFEHDQDQNWFDQLGDFNEFEDGNGYGNGYNHQAMPIQIQPRPRNYRYGTRKPSQHNPQHNHRDRDRRPKDTRLSRRKPTMKVHRKEKREPFDSWYKTHHSKERSRGRRDDKYKRKK